MASLKGDFFTTLVSASYIIVGFTTVWHICILPFDPQVDFSVSRNPSHDKNKSFLLALSFQSPMVTLLTDDIEVGFEHNQKVGVALVDLTAAYDTVWLRGLHLKLLRMLPDRHMVSFVMELLTNRILTPRTSDGQVSRLRRIHNGAPKGSTLAPTLFNIYISDIPKTTSKQYGYADDLALLAAHQTWEKVEETINQDVQSLSEYLSRWRLKLSTTNTTTTAFHLNNRDTRRQIGVVVNGAPLPNNNNPVYLSGTLDQALTYRKHLESLRSNVNARNGLLRCLAGSSWGAYIYTSTLRTGVLARGVVASIAALPSFRQPALPLQQAVVETESPAMWHHPCWRNVETLGCSRVGHVCLRTHNTGAACGRGLPNTQGPWWLCWSSTPRCSNWKT